MQSQKNMLIFFVSVLVIITGWNIFYERPRMEEERARIAAQEALNPTPTPTPTPELRDRAEILAETPRIKVNAPDLHGSIALNGARIDDITLAKYTQTPGGENEVVLLAPQGARVSYFAETGWIGQNIKTPKSDSLWTADGEELTPSTPVTLSWDNGEGLVFEKRFAIDEQYMFTISESVRNSTDSDVTLTPYARANRGQMPADFKGFFILHEGPIGVFNGKQEEPDYDELRDGETLKAETTGGWMGFTDKYWLVALVPPQEMKVTSTTQAILKSGSKDEFAYQVDWLGDGMQIKAGQSVDLSSRIFVGAKEVDILNGYMTDAENPIPNFDLAVDWGWFYFLTKPFFHLLNWIASMTGYWPAILIITLMVKIIMIPLANKSYASMTRMKLLGPKVTALREKYEKNPQKLQSEMMGLYKKEGVNPMSGCLPIFAQIPVFFSLYKVLFISIEMRHAPFPGWIEDMSAPDPTTVFNLFGLLPFDVPSFLMLGAWPIIMGATMVLQTKLNPPPPDPTQAKVMQFMPIMFTILLAGFPAGLVIYWAWNNTLSIAQQYFIQRKVVARIEAEHEARNPSKAKGVYGVKESAQSSQDA